MEAPSLGRTLTGSTGASAETEARLQGLVRDLFHLADVDSNGTIQFKEFIDHHNRVLEMASDSLGRAEVLTGEEAQKLFRQADKDHNHRLDKEEFFDYMHGLLSVVGLKQFESICATLVAEETLRRAVIAEGFDRKSSERLLEQAGVAWFYKQPMKDQALSFLKARADPNVTDKNGTSVLLNVTGKTDAQFASQLIAARCDPQRHNKDFDCPLFRAAKARHIDVMKVLLGQEWAPPEEDDGEKSPAKRAPAQVNEELVKQMHDLTGAQIRQLVAKRADVNYKALNGWTPLTLAVFHGKLDCVETLVKLQDPMKGIKLQLQGKNAKGRAPLHLAARKDMPEIAQLLLKNGADPDVRDMDGWTPLHHGCFNGNSMVVRALLQGGANLLIQGVGGFTAFLVTRLPQRACDLSDSTLDSLKPQEGVDFQKRVVPIFKGEEMTVLQKIEELLNLPGVNQMPERLRLHEQFFHPLQGPNKVKLKLVWSTLISPLIPRLRTGAVDMEVTPNPHLSEEGKAEYLAEVKRRQTLQNDFFKQWLYDTRGPRPNYYWKFDNREAYRTELNNLLQLELAEYRMEFDKLYEKMVDEEDFGSELADIEAEVLLDKSVLSQLRAHHFPLWVEQLDLVEALDQLRTVGAAGFAGLKDDHVALLNLVEQLTISHNLRCGRMFWRNAYRTWLLQLAQMSDHEAARKIRVIVDKFNAENPSLPATYRHGPVKTEERTKHKEHALGLTPTADTFDTRTSTSQIFDLIRGTISVSSPKAVLKLVEVFKGFDKSMDRLQLVRVINRFNKESASLDGHRFVEMHVLFRNGVRAAACGREDKSVDLTMVGEVCIVLEDFLKVHKRRHLLYKLKEGVFDWSPDDDELDNDVDLESSLRGDDLPQ